MLVSGLGGSGTRVAAQMCRQLGVDMGTDVNAADDDLLFTLLVKRPALLRRAGLEVPAHDVLEVVGTYEHCQQGRRVTARAALHLASAVRDAVVSGRERPTVARRAVWAARRLAALVPPQAPRPPWGIKEPTAHVALPHLLERWPSLRYVHVVRDPADYAVKPHAQLVLWGAVLGVPVPRTAAEWPAAQLRYWARANGRAVRLASAKVPTMVLRLEDAVASPAVEARRLADFLGRAVGAERLAAAAAVAVVPPSAGRGGALDPARVLDDEDLAVLRDFGYG